MYEKALRNLIVFMFGHYIDCLENHDSWVGHRAILALECMMVANDLGQYQQWYKRLDLDHPERSPPDWRVPETIDKKDAQKQFSSAMSLLGDPKEPSYGHLKQLSQYFDHIYHEGRFIGQLSWGS